MKMGKLWQVGEIRGSGVVLDKYNTGIEKRWRPEW
jgi:hypothetical protein